MFLVFILLLAGWIFFVRNITSQYEVGVTKPLPTSGMPDREEEEETISESPSYPPEEPQLPTFEPGIIPPEIAWGDKTKRQVIFTFDGGSGTQSGQAILDTLKGHGLQSTFFLTGQWISKNPDLTVQMVQEGHEVFNHTYMHPHLPQLSEGQIIEEFQKTEDILLQTAGVSTKPYFRPPYGERDSRVLEIASKEGYQSVFWTIDVQDWRESEGFTDEQAKERIFKNLKPGTIYLFHIGDTITGRILNEVIRRIKEEGYEVVSLRQGL